MPSNQKKVIKTYKIKINRNIEIFFKDKGKTPPRWYININLQITT